MHGALRTVRFSNDARFLNDARFSWTTRGSRPGSRVLGVTGGASVISANPGASGRSSHPIGGGLAIRGNGW